MHFGGEKTEHNFHKRSNKTLDVKCAIEHNGVIQQRVILSRQMGKEKLYALFLLQNSSYFQTSVHDFCITDFFSNWRWCVQRLSTALVTSAHEAWSEVLVYNVIGKKLCFLREKQSVDLSGIKRIFCQLLRGLSCCPVCPLIIMMSNNH